jgi:poly(3-hydroxyalkanoate) depolymerase
LQLSSTGEVAVVPRFVEVDGLTLRVAERGSGRPLLMIGGIGTNIEMWQPLQSHLDGLQTITFDAPGTGRSDTPRWPLRMRGLARIVAGILDQLDHRQVDVLGYSFGGALAQQLAHDAPGRVRRLILAATTAGMASVPGSLRALGLMLTPMRYYSPEHLKRIIGTIAGGRTAREPDVFREHAAARLLAPPSVWGYESQILAMTGWTSALWLHRLRQPVLVLAGDEDPLVPLVNARLLARLLPDARMHVVSGGGHLFLLDQPDDVVDVIQRFLSDPSV